MLSQILNSFLCHKFGDRHDLTIVNAKSIERKSETKSVQLD
jgi:hypothetical protein